MSLGHEVFGQQLRRVWLRVLEGRPDVGYLDTVVDTAKEQLRHVAGAVANRTGHRERAQSVTIRPDPETVQQLFRDPGRLSEVLGDIAEVQQTGDDNFRWVFRVGPLDGASWDSRLVTDSGQLRFVGAGQNGSTAANSFWISKRHRSAGAPS